MGPKLKSKGGLSLRKANEKAANTQTCSIYLERVPNARLVVQHDPDGRSFIFAIAICGSILQQYMYT